MPKVGLRYPLYCVLDEQEVPGPGKVMGRMKKANIKITTTDIEDYSDDALGESLKVFSEGSVSFENDDLEDEVSAELLGEAKNETGEYESTDKDEAPYVRVGFIVTRYHKNKWHYRVLIYPKVKFAIPDDEYETQGKTQSFKSVTINGTLYRDKTGKWRIRKEFPDLQAAIEYINSKMNVAVTPAANPEGGEET